MLRKRKVIKCKVKNNELKSIKYYIGFTGLVDNPKETLLIHIAVKDNQINETDLVLIAKSIKEKFCNEMRLVLLIFDAKKPADFFDLTFKTDRDALRGEYVLDREKGEEYISFVKIPNYFENPNDRIKIDLTTINNSEVVKP